MVLEVRQTEAECLGYLLDDTDKYRRNRHNGDAYDDFRDIPVPDELIEDYLREPEHQHGRRRVAYLRKDREHEIPRVKPEEPGYIFEHK